MDRSEYVERTVRELDARILDLTEQRDQLSEEREALLDGRAAIAGPIDARPKPALSPSLAEAVAGIDVHLLSLTERRIAVVEELQRVTDARVALGGPIETSRPPTHEPRRASEM